jgi:hypothetical protein
MTVIGAVVAAVAWRLIVNRSRNASEVLRIVVPDVLLLASASQPGTTTGGVVALMLMHFGVAAAAIPAFRRLMPPRS